MVTGLSTGASSGSHPSTSMTPSRQERHCSTSSSSSSSSPTVTSSGNKTRERENRIEGDISPVTVSTNVDDRTGQAVVHQANNTQKTKKRATERTERPVVCRESNHEQGRQANPKPPKTNKKETMIERGNPLFADSGRAPLSSEVSEWLQEFRQNLFRMMFLNIETHTPVLLMKHL